MSRMFRAESGDGPLSAERRRVLDALDVDVLTGPAIARRVHTDRLDSADQALLYPALYSLEARWKLQAEWLPGQDGVRHRTYRKRHLRPR